MVKIIRKPIVAPVERIELKADEYSTSTLRITRSKKNPGALTVYTVNGVNENICAHVPKADIPDFFAAIKELCNM
jgi:hypothetical protein